MKYNTIKEANTATLDFAKKGGELSDEFLTHIKAVLELFHGPIGDHNIGLLNEILSAAGRMRLQRTRMRDWLVQLTGHMPKQDGNKAAILGKKSKHITYAEILERVPAFLTEHPDWTKYSSPNEPTFDMAKAWDKLSKSIAKLQEQATDNDFAHVAELLMGLGQVVEAQDFEGSYAHDKEAIRKAAADAAIEAAEADQEVNDAEMTVLEAALTKVVEADQAAAAA